MERKYVHLNEALLFNKWCYLQKRTVKEEKDEELVEIKKEIENMLSRKNCEIEQGQKTRYA